MKSIQIKDQLHKQLSKEKVGRFKTIGHLISYYRKLALQFIKQNK